MKLITRFLYLSAAGIMLLTSCAKGADRIV